MKKIILSGFPEGIDNTLLKQLNDIGNECVVVRQHRELEKFLQDEQEILIVLKVTNPELDRKMLQQIREIQERILIIVVGQTKSAEERISWLNHGAYDCVSRDCSWGELVTRIQVILRRF